MTKERQTLGELMRFSLVGLIGLSIDATAYVSLSAGLGLSESWAKRLSFALICAWGFFANKRYTFRQREAQLTELPKFALVYGIGWGLNSLTHDTCHLLLSSNALAFLIASSVWACWNFIGQKWFVFRSSDQELP